MEHYFRPNNQKVMPYFDRDLILFDTLFHSYSTKSLTTAYLVSLEKPRPSTGGGGKNSGALGMARNLYAA